MPQFEPSYNEELDDDLVTNYIACKVCKLKLSQLRTGTIGCDCEFFNQFIENDLDEDDEEF